MLIGRCMPVNQLMNYTQKELFWLGYYACVVELYYLLLVAYADRGDGVWWCCCEHT